MSKDKDSKRKTQPLGPYQELLESLSDAAARVNEAASVASDQIEALEKALLEIEPGVTVWTAPMQLGATTLVSEDGHSQNATREMKFGFGKLQKWGLLVSETWIANDGSALASMVQPLRKAEREARLLALPHLTSVLQALLSALEGAATRLPRSEPPPEYNDGVA